MNMTDYFEFNGILIGELWRGIVMKMNKLKGLLLEKTSLKDKLFEIYSTSLIKLHICLTLYLYMYYIFSRQLAEPYCTWDHMLHNSPVGK